MPMLPGMAPGYPMDPKSMALQALLGSVETMQPETIRPPGTPLPVQSPAMNPEFTQMILQAMMGAQGQPTPSLGAILAGA